MFIPILRGVEFRSSERTLQLGGDGIYQLAERLIPLLDGRFSEGEICQGLPPDKRQCVQRFCGLLLQHGFLKQGPKRRLPSSLPIGIPNYADCLSTDRTDDLHRFGRSAIIVLGYGLGVLALIHSLIDIGVSTISYAAESEIANRLADYEDYIGRTTRPVSLTNIGSYADTKMITGRYDAVFCFWRELRNIADTLAQFENVPEFVLPIAVYDNWAVLGPLQISRAGGCFACLASGLQNGLLGRMTVCENPSNQRHPVSLSAPAAALLSAEASFEYLRHECKLGPLRLDRNLLVVHLRTLTIGMVKWHTTCECRAAAR